MSGASKLLLLNSYHYRRGGADVVYLDQESMFAGLGWRIATMAMRHPKNLPSIWSEWFVDELEFGQTQGLADKLLKASKVIWSFEAQKKLRGLLAEFRPDVAHLHNIYHHQSPSILPVLRKAGIPTVMTAHDLKIACPNNKMIHGRRRVRTLQGRPAS